MIVNEFVTLTEREKIMEKMGGKWGKERSEKEHESITNRKVSKF